MVSAAQALASDKAVVLFVDTFNGHFESETASDAFKVLSAAGYDVHIAAKTPAEPQSLELSVARRVSG